MKLHDELVKKLGNTYEASSLVNLRFRDKDLVVKTDEKGNAILLFIGKLTEKGTIEGERFVRTLVYDKYGAIIKDHWELKGKAG